MTQINLSVRLCTHLTAVSIPIYTNSLKNHSNISYFIRFLTLISTMWPRTQGHQLHPNSSGAKSCQNEGNKGQASAPIHRTPKHELHIVLCKPFNAFTHTNKGLSKKQSFNKTDSKKKLVIRHWFPLTLFPCHCKASSLLHSELLDDSRNTSCNTKKHRNPTGEHSPFSGLGSSFSALLSFQVSSAKKKKDRFGSLFSCSPSLF